MAARRDGEAHGSLHQSTYDADTAATRREASTGIGMGRVVEAELSRSELELRLVPRDDVIVLEGLVEDSPPRPQRSGTTIDPAGRSDYDALEGPFRHYRRTVEWRQGSEDRYLVRQQVSFRPAMSVFGLLYTPLIRMSLRRPATRGRHPWWAMPDRLNAHQSTVIAVMCLFHVVGGMLYGFLTNVLTFASADLGNGSPGEQSLVFVVTRIGAVITLVVMAAADRVGRRRVAVWSAGLAAMLTVLSALAPSLWMLAGLQTLSRNLAITAMIAADTVSVEEIPAGSRAAAQGLGALSYGLGAGIAVICLPLADIGDSGWRLVFAVGVLALPLVAIGARSLPESGRFEAGVADRAGGTDKAGGAGGAGASGHGASRHRLRLNRLLIVGALFFLVNTFVAPSSQLQNDYLRADRGFDGSRITLFLVVTSVPGAIGILLGGRWADRRGRRGVIIVGLVSLAVFTTGFFVLDGVGMWVSATLGAVLGTLSVPAMGALAPELFPTARRGAARGTLSAVATAGSVLGLLAAGALADRVGYGATFVWLALAPLAGAALSGVLPETAGRELEEINENADDGPTSAGGSRRSLRPDP
jgi:MFS family permease